MNDNDKSYSQTDVTDDATTSGITKYNTQLNRLLRRAVALTLMNFSNLLLNSRTLNILYSLYVPAPL